MTLCVAWIRQEQNDEGEELVFATDSRLRGGEKWDSGIKLFDLGRSDCLLCFAGDTQRAYPLILHGSNTFRSHIEWSNPRLDLYDVLDLLCKLFTDLCNTIGDLPSRMKLHTEIAEAQFLFGGWSWREQQFGIWKLYYSNELKAFTHDAQHLEATKGRIFTFLGDYVEEAEQLLDDDLHINRKALRYPLDMEPLRVLARMARDDSKYDSIGGALQVAKVYRSGHNEFFGIIWPSSEGGKPAFLGRDLNPYDAPPMRFIDPDTAGFIETLPDYFMDIDTYDFGNETRFVRDCYQDHKLKPNLGEAQRDRLKRIFKDLAYEDFVAKRESVSNIAVKVGTNGSNIEAIQKEAEVIKFEEGIAHE